VEALVELRFPRNPKLPIPELFGRLYKQVGSEFPQNEVFPILHLPEAVRTADPNLLNQPYYKLYNSQFQVRVGPSVLSIGTITKYPGWSKLLPEIIKVVSSANEAGIFNKIERVGLRYINFFEGDVFPKTTLTIGIEGSPLPTQSTQLIVPIVRGEENIRLQLIIAANLTVKNEWMNAQGSVIDIDSSFLVTPADFFSSATKFLNILHEEEKKLFYRILKQDYVSTLNPKY
jgi:uncharacterized protein (TIGR04255 family)